MSLSSPSRVFQGYVLLRFTCALFHISIATPCIYLGDNCGGCGCCTACHISIASNHFIANDQWLPREDFASSVSSRIPASNEVHTTFCHHSLSMLAIEHARTYDQEQAPPAICQCTSTHAAAGVINDDDNDCHRRCMSSIWATLGICLIAHAASQLVLAQQ